MSSSSASLSSVVPGGQARPATPAASPGLIVPLAVLLVASLMIKLALMTSIDGRAYGDVLRSVSFGLGVEEGIISIRTHVDNTKSFLGPLLNAAVYDAGGLPAIKMLNLGLFVALYATMFALGRGQHDDRVILVALFLLAFYAGGHRNIAAGELEDSLASVLFAGALLGYLRFGIVFASAALMGLAFLTKFWVAVFIGAFGIFLLLARRWRQAVLAAAGALLPVAVITALDGGATLRSLVMTVDRQMGFSSWQLLGFRMFSTGLLPTVVVSAWMVARRPDARRLLYFGLVAGYFAYVILFRDAHAVTFVMMLCLVFAGYLVAEFLVHSPAVGAAARHGMARLALVLAAYAAANTAIAWQNLYRDTHPFQVTPGKDARPLTQRMDIRARPSGPSGSGRPAGRSSALRMQATESPEDELFTV
jgi:hypothetical protein